MVFNNMEYFMILTPKEKDLIESIRNYKKSYPKSLQLEIYINLLFAELMDD